MVVGTTLRARRIGRRLVFLGLFAVGVVGIVGIVGVGAGCAGPMGVIPGGALEGPERVVEGARFPAESVLSEAGVIQLETRPSDPYSVNLRARVIAGHVYVDPTEARAWYSHIQADDRVRVRLWSTETIYRARAVVEEDPEVLEQFGSDRRVLRIEPRSQ